MAGIFGPGADLTAQAIQQEQQANAMQWANVPQGRGTVAGMAQAGSMLGSGLAKLGGYEDPRLAKAKLLEEARMEVDSSGADLMSDPKSYYTAAFKALQSRGLTDEAMQVRSILIDEESASADAEYKRAKAKDLEGKGRYQRIGSGGLYDTETGTVVAPGKTSSDTPNSDIGELKKDLKDGLITQEEFDAKFKKITNIKTSGGIEALAGAVGSMADALKANAQLKEGGKSDDKYINSLGDRADSAATILRQTQNIKAALETGDMNFGALGEQRRALAGIFSTFAPNIADEAATLMKFDIGSYDIVERASSTILAEVAKAAAGGGRMTQAALQTLQKAGPAVWQTNEGLRVATSMMEKSAQFELDRALFADTLAPTDNIRAEVRKWTYENIDNPKYNISAAELKSIQEISKRADGMKELAKIAVPHPKDPKNYINGKIYYHPEKGYAKAIVDRQGGLRFKPLTFGE